MPRPWQVILWRRTYGLEIVEGHKRQAGPGAARGLTGSGEGKTQAVSLQFPIEAVRSWLGLGRTRYMQLQDVPYYIYYVASY